MFELVNSDALEPSDVARLHTELRQAGIAEPGPLLEAYRAHTGASDLADLRAAFLGDAVLRAPATHLTRAQVAARGGAYRHLLLDKPCGSTLCAFHGADLLYLLAKLSLVDADTPRHLAVRDTLTADWAVFAATGAPDRPSYEAESKGNSRAIGGPSPPTTR